MSDQQQAPQVPAADENQLIAERREKLAADPDRLEHILRDGAARARVEAAKTLQQARKAVGLE